MRHVVLVSGRVCNGKSGLAKRLAEEFGYYIVKTSEILRREARRSGTQMDRRSLQALGDRMDEESQGSWILDEVLSRMSTLPPNQSIVVDNIRTAAQLDQFRRNPAVTVAHVHLYAPTKELHARFARRASSDPSLAHETYESIDHIKVDADIDSFKKDADVRINTGRTDQRDSLVRVAARLGLYSPPNVRCVDVLVGGQYGSEGKGHIAAYLAREYDVLVRVGGPNAGHTVSGASGVYTYHQLPSGAKDTTAKLLLGPGMTIYVPDLLREISECGVTADRLFIDPQAMVIEDSDKAAESRLVSSIASTGSGSGSAAARRILERGLGTVRLARDCEDLRPYVGEGETYRGSTTRQLELAYARRASILVEGTQGSGLSIYHGSYPHVTSRDTNVAGCLAEAGISPSRVRRILMVVRPTPIRVGDPDGAAGYTSGGLKHEVTFSTVAQEAGLDPEEVTKLEKTSTTKRSRRVGWFEWEQFRQACALNAPSDIVLTFADYVDAGNQKARRFEQLSEATIKFIEELERVAQAPVSLINTRFPRDSAERLDLRTVIDRRNWASIGRREY